MTLTTKDVETRLRTSLHSTIPQLLADQPQFSSTAAATDASADEPSILEFTRTENTGLRSAGNRWRLLGAAAAAVLLVGGLAIAQRPRTEPAPGAQSPESAPVSEVPVPPATAPKLPAPALRPDVFAVVPDSYPNAELASAMWGGQIGSNGTTVAEALVARVDGSTLTDGYQLSVRSVPDDVFPDEPQAAKVAGLDVQVYVENGTPALTTVVLPGTPTLTVTGQAPMQFIEEAGGFPIAGARVDDDGDVTFAVGALPVGYDIVVPPSQLPIGSIEAATRVPDRDGGDGLAVRVQVRNPLISYAQVGDLQQVDVNGVTGWMIDSGPGSPVMWPASLTTWALVGGATNVDNALDFARSVDFVDEDEWAQRYGVEPENYPLPNDEVATTDVVKTTIVVEQPELIAIDAVVCVGAGASELAIGLCLDELGGDGPAVQAIKDTDTSFVMPIDPANPSHATETTAIGDVLGLPVVEFDASYLLPSVIVDPAATTYLVLGRNDVPYVL
jgi:hypothetical protein